MGRAEKVVRARQAEAARQAEVERRASQERLRSEAAPLQREIEALVPLVMALAEQLDYPEARMTSRLKKRRWRDGVRIYQDIAGWELSHWAYDDDQGDTHSGSYWLFSDGTIEPPPPPDVSKTRGIRDGLVALHEQLSAYRG